VVHSRRAACIPAFNRITATPSHLIRGAELHSRGFFSSFENTDPPLTWIDTTDLGRDGTPRAAGATLTTREGRGPAKPATAKPRVGFTGLRALRYAGSHTAQGPGTVTNKLFLLELPITEHTELSYVILPEPRGDDLRFPSTYVAVDLAFSDGTYLSDLGAADQLGFPLTARGQGESRALTPNQWNIRRVRLGVAAGRTAVRALLTYDFPDGPAEYAGWLDDITITDRPPRQPTRPVEYVVTTRGTDSTRGYSRGNTIPATAVPHGFTFWTPVTDAGAQGWLYTYHRHNNDQNLPALEALAASHLPSPWMGDRQTFQVLPSVAPKTPSTRRRKRKLTFRHANEQARPHHYRVRFTNGVVAEIAPADHAAILRFTFPGEDANLVFDNVNRHGRLTLDPGAVAAVVDRRSSLLPAGVVAVDGEFAAGDPVDLIDQNGDAVARGLVNYDAAELPALLGRSTRDLAATLGAGYDREVVHRDDLVVLRP